MTSTDTNAKSTAPSVSAQPVKSGQTAASVKPAAAPAAPAAAPAAPPVEVLTFDKEKFAARGVSVVRMRLLTAGIIQYDPDNSELILDTADQKGKLLPLTPFFAQRIGRTLELVL